MQVHNDDNNLTSPLFSDSSPNKDSGEQQNSLESALQIENLKKLFSSMENHDFNIQSVRHRFLKEFVENNSKSHEIANEEDLGTAPTIFGTPEIKIRVFLNPIIVLLILFNFSLLTSFRRSEDDKINVNFKLVTSALSYISSNLAADPILDIIKIQDDGSCPQNYEDLVLDVWPGTVHGCDCPHGLRVGKCQKSERSSSCDDYAPISPINISHWGGSQWCILRAKPGSQYVKSSKCFEGFRKCSPGICVVDRIDCPVTKIRMERGEIVMGKVKGELPVIGFGITWDENSCFGDENFAEARVAPYILINQSKEGCCKYSLKEKYNFVLDSQGQKKLFEQNGFPEKVLGLPDYAKVYEKTKAVLSYQNRLNIAEKDICLNVNTEILGKSSEAIEKLEKFMELALGLEIYHSMLVGMVILMIIVLRISNNSWIEILKGEISLGWIAWYVLFGIAEYIGAGVLFAATLYYKAEVTGTHEYLNNLVKMGCFLDQQQQAENILRDYGAVVNEETGTRLKCSFVVFLITSLSFITSLCLACNSCRKGSCEWRRRELSKNANSYGKARLELYKYMKKPN